MVKNWFRKWRNHYSVVFAILSPTAGEIFNQLEHEITEYMKEGEVLLCGDFNARTGGLTDYLSLDEIGQTFSDCPIPN